MNAPSASPPSIDEGPFSHEQIHKAIEKTPQLASLRSINDALSELLHAEQGISSQIAEIIRRDPSLTSRLLKLVNSVFFGLNQKVNNIEEAVVYLGLKQIRELALATPVIEDMQSLSGILTENDCREIWRHSIGCAVLTREILAIANVTYNDDTDYIMGLVHNIGKIVIASAFPQVFKNIIYLEGNSTIDICIQEEALLGSDHAAVGAYYLGKHELSEEIVQATRYHNIPEEAEDFTKSAAAIQLSDAMVRSMEVPGIERVPAPNKEDWIKLSGWTILFGENEEEYPLIIASLRNALMRLPYILRGMI
tara:strand:+ start:41 stop:964 length:924 start_codon:yes stop_codon:yes gene_type:complete